jgi:hypothetical protein
MASNPIFEISRFTFFFQDFGSECLSMTKSEKITNEFEVHQDIQDLFASSGKSSIQEALPLSHNFLNLWKEEYDKKALCKIKYTGAEIFLYTFNILNNNVIIFEKKVCSDLSEKLKAIEEAKKDCKNFYRSIILQKLPNWKGDYKSDGDDFYFINTPVEGFEDNQSNDLPIIKNLMKELTIEEKCIFTHLGFEDKTFPNLENYTLGLSQTLVNEKQPLIVISPVRDKNKLVIFDDKLFVRCYKNNSENFKQSVSLRIVVLTVLYQRAYLEYTSNVLVNVADDNIKSINSFKTIQKEFGKFVDIFWRLDISNSFYLNKSYRVIGKLWLLNEKYEIVRQHLERNSDVENQSSQIKISQLLLAIGVLTSISITKDAVGLYMDFTTIPHTLKPALLIFTIFAIFFYWLFKKK